MKKSIAIFVCALFATGAISQQLPHHSQYMFNDFFINPAVAGSTDEMKAMLTFRNQWTGFKGAPTTATASFHSSILSNMGVGAVLFDDRTGPLVRTGAQLSYAYQLKLSTKSMLGLGLSGMMYQHVLDKNQLTTADPGDLALDGKEAIFIPDATFGMYFYSGDFYAGLSAPQILQSKINYENIRVTEESKLVRHFFLHSGYRFSISENFELEPSMLLKAAMNAPVQVDINARAIYNDFLWLGFSYRHTESVIAIIGIKKGKFYGGYSYDMTLSNIRNHSDGSHEIMLGMNITKQQKETETSIE